MEVEPAQRHAVVAAAVAAEKLKLVGPERARIGPSVKKDHRRPRRVAELEGGHAAGMVGHHARAERVAIADAVLVILAEIVSKQRVGDAARARACCGQ